MSTNLSINERIDVYNQLISVLKPEQRLFVSCRAFMRVSGWKKTLIAQTFLSDINNAKAFQVFSLLVWDCLEYEEQQHLDKEIRNTRALHKSKILDKAENEILLLLGTILARNILAGQASNKSS